MTEQIPREDNRAQAVVWAGAAVLLAAMYWDVGGYFWQRWLQEDTYHHCLFVPPVVGWLIWSRREALAKLRPTADWRGAVLLGAGALLYVVAMRVGVRVAIGFSFPLIIAGLIWASLGSRFLGKLWYPVVLLLFVVPVPKHILGHLGMPLQVTSAAGAAKAAHLLGLPVVHDGINLTLNGHTYVIAEACSGLNSLLALVFAAAVLVEVMGVRSTARLVLLLSPAVVLAGNIVRLVSVLLFAEFAGPGFAMDSLVHGGSDIIVYLAAFGFMWLLIDLVSERRMLAIILGRDDHPSDLVADRGTTPSRAQGEATTPSREHPTEGDGAPLEGLCK